MVESAFTGIVRLPGFAFARFCITLLVPSDFLLRHAADAMASLQSWLASLSPTQRLFLVALVVVAAHLVVLLIRRVTTRWIHLSSKQSNRKASSLLSLASSTLIFVFYFAAGGFLLTELGVPITAYLASASIIGLAVGFGSQGLVQDVVTGMTSIFSDVYDIGDMVEISAQVGVVKKIGLRFLEIENPLGARVMIPNRSIGNVINYRRGYIRCIADITLPPEQDATPREQIIERLKLLAQGVHDQFPGILVTPPAIEGEKQTSAGRRFLRIKFRVWPGRGTPIEQSFKQEVVQELARLDSAYKDWMVAVYYEIEPKH